MNTRSTLLSVALLTLSLNAMAEVGTCKSFTDHIQNTRAEYSLTHNQIPGQLAVTTHTLKITGKHYKIDSVSQATGFMAMVYSGTLNQTSTGDFDIKTGLNPTFYSEKHGKKAAKETVVDAETQEVIFKKNNTRAPYESGTQDRLSMVYELAAKLSCSGNISSGDVVPFRVMSTGRVSTEKFKFTGEEPITVSAGKGTQTVNAMRFESEVQEADDDKIRLWFSPELKWVPVKIQVEDSKGTQLTQTLTGLKL